MLLRRVVDESFHVVGSQTCGQYVVGQPDQLVHYYQIGYPVTHKTVQGHS